MYDTAILKDRNRHRHPRPLVVETDHSGLVGTGAERIITNTYNDCTVARSFLLSLVGLYLQQPH